MHQIKKDNQWYFGMKMHIGADAKTGTAHSLTNTPVNHHDITQADQLLHGEGEDVFADSGYRGIEKRGEHKDRQVKWHIAMMPGKRRALSNSPLGCTLDHLEKVKASVRVKVEHPFRIIKRQFGYDKVRYLGLEKNDDDLHTMFAQANASTQIRKELERSGDNILKTEQFITQDDINAKLFESLEKLDERIDNFEAKITSQ